MSSPIPVALTREFREGSVKKVTIGSTEILLAKVNGQFYAAEPFCPHLGADLSQGTLHGTILTCPMHNSQFDLRNGRIVKWTDLKGTILTLAKKARPPRPLKCFKVTAEGEKIFVDLS